MERSDIQMILDAKTIEIEAEWKIRKRIRNYLKTTSYSKNLKIDYKEKWLPWKSTFHINVIGSKTDVLYWCRISQVYIDFL